MLLCALCTMFEQFLTSISSYTYPGLFVTCFLASTVLPLGSEFLVAVLIRAGYSFTGVVMVASIGNYLGACTSYYIGLKGRSGIIEKYLSISTDELKKADSWFTKYGSYALLFTWLPVIGDAITVSGGLLKLDFKTFSILVFLGKFFRYLVLAYIASSL